MKPKTLKCKFCKERFVPFRNNGLQKYCMAKDECIKEFRKSVEDQRQKAWRKKKKEIKQKLKTHSDHQKDLQVQINKLARTIDFGNDCMMCKGKLKGSSFGCHYHSVGSNNSLRFNLYNIWIGCRSCNEFKGGNILGYDEVLIETFGRHKWNWIKFGIKEDYPEIKMTREEIKEKVKIAKKLIKETPLEIRTPIERWDMRIELNEKLNIY